MANDDELEMWVVYDHPRDFPNTFVARKWTVGNGRAERPTDDIIVSPEITALRKMLALKGLICTVRHPTDEPQVMEVWF